MLLGYVHPSQLSFDFVARGAFERFPGVDRPHFGNA
jgi:hypothetical protein